MIKFILQDGASVFALFCLFILIWTALSDNPALYRVERFTYKNGKSTGSRMEHDCKQINYNTYTCKYDSILASNQGYDSVIFVIVKQ